jgi:hypothetical protein
MQSFRMRPTHMQRLGFVVPETNVKSRTGNSRKTPPKRHVVRVCLCGHVFSVVTNPATETMGCNLREREKGQRKYIYTYIYMGLDMWAASGRTHAFPSLAGGGCTDDPIGFSLTRKVHVLSHVQIPLTSTTFQMIKQPQRSSASVT